MRGALIIIGVIAGAIWSSSIATAETKSRKIMYAKPALFMRVYGPAQPPYGFVRYCDSRPQACAASPLEDMRFQPTAEHLSELDEVNRSINHAIAPATDVEIYGVSEHWTLPSSQGDCEDYALLKQKVLLQRGWPSSALLLTVVRDEKGDGHAVLTARTAQGDYILDNKIDEVRLWNRTGYEYMMRQSYIDPRVWVSLDETSGDIPHSLAAAANNR